ncbi:MAG: bifunctional riboflavin kinase/FAD synthetase [Gammaproteobacteria bacterium]|nr:bifunctional riboflavin kinase/FAD synthetase [Gammaproteobacteria bacterium]
MELIRGLHNLKPHHHGCVATIGNFDGVHLGHQHVLGELAEKADEMKLPAVVITFEPQPQEFFTPERCPGRLTRFREKIKALRRLAVDRVFTLHFNQKLAAMEPEDFIQKILVDGLGVRYLVVGGDFRFGKKRRGNFEMLQQAGAKHGFQVVNMHTFQIAGERVSSTRIRQTLKEGDLDHAEILLGRPYRMCGRVAHGHKRGRQIGFPTANIHLHRKVSPIEGVFAVEMFGVEGEPVSGVANVGTRPTVNGTRTVLEVHLFDFEGDIYGRHVMVDFLKKIRSEQKFDSFELLKEQILLDAAQARAYFRLRYSN